MIVQLHYNVHAHGLCLVVALDDDKFDNTSAQCESTSEGDIDDPESDGCDYMPESILQASG